MLIFSAYQYRTGFKAYTSTRVELTSIAINPRDPYQFVVGGGDPVVRYHIYFILILFHLIGNHQLKREMRLIINTKLRCYESYKELILFVQFVITFRIYDRRKLSSTSSQALYKFLPTPIKEARYPFLTHPH